MAIVRKKNMPKWILASASPRRKEILARLGMRFRIDPSGILEPSRTANETPAAYVARIARLKARGVAKKYRSSFIIGADTVVVLGRSILGKPSNREEARAMLNRLSGRWHEVLSGLCVLDCEKARSHSGYSRTRVRFRRLSPSDIDWYLKTGEYRDKAGAYAVQGYASLFIDRIEGCYFNVVGFPISVFETLCRSAGIHLKDQLIRDSRFKIPD
jgi:septum formation protein